MIVAETDRLVIRHLCPADAEPLEAVFCDPEVMRYSSPLRTPEWIRGHIAEMVGTLYPKWGFGRWAVVERASTNTIGYCGLQAWEMPAGEAHLGYRLARSAWGRGFATEAAAATCALGFDGLDLWKIIAAIAPDNAGSINVAKKLGMQYQSTEPNYFDPNCIEHRYVLTRPRP